MNSLRPHPIYKNYGYDLEKEHIIHMSTKKELKQREHTSGYYMSSFTGYSFMSHRFIWECCNDIIPKGYEIDHINKIKRDNRIENLRCITISENRKNRDHTNIIKNAAVAHKMKRFIKAINIDTEQFLCFKGKNQCGKHLGISAALVYLIIEGLNRAKTANTNKGRYIFEYIDENDVTNLVEIPHGRIGKTYVKPLKANDI